MILTHESGQRGLGWLPHATFRVAKMRLFPVTYERGQHIRGLLARMLSGISSCKVGSQMPGHHRSRGRSEGIVVCHMHQLEVTLVRRPRKFFAFGNPNPDSDPDVGGQAGTSGSSCAGEACSS